MSHLLIQHLLKRFLKHQQKLKKKKRKQKNLQALKNIEILNHNAKRPNAPLILEIGKV